MTQKKSACRDAEQNLLVVTQKKTACRDAEKNLLIVTQKKSQDLSTLQGGSGRGREGFGREIRGGRERKVLDTF